jgi:DNA-binding Lrp family transcriptional regulator
VAAADRIDLSILAELIDNSKQTLADIGMKLNLHPNVVAYRIKKMERLGLIKRYSVVVDLEKIGLNEQAYLYIDFKDQIEKESVLKAIADLPHTIRVESLIGSPEAIVFIAGKNKEEIDKIISLIKNMGVTIKHTSSTIKCYQDWFSGNLCRYISGKVKSIKKIEEKTALTIQTKTFPKF